MHLGGPSHNKHSIVKCEPRANGIEGIDCSKYVARMNVSGVGQIWAAARGSASHSKGIFSVHTWFLFNGRKQKLSQVAQSRESQAGNRTQERAFGQFSK